MNCDEFKIWLLDKDAHGRADDQEAEAHRSICLRCKALYSLDATMEKQIKSELASVSPPAELYSKIEGNIRSEDVKKKTSAARSKMLIPALAVAAIVFFIFINPFAGPIRTINEFGSLAMATHLDDNMKMEFKAGEVKDVAGWFSKRIGLVAVAPDMADMGFKFLGGRPCTLKNKEAAYLYYEKNGKPCSLFVLNQEGLKFKLEKNRTYHVKENDLDMKVWTDKGLVYAIVI
jgi:anti-sigma factor RsiW